VSDRSRRVPFLLVLYEQYLDQQDTEDFTNKARQFYTQGTLERLAENEAREVRRAAVLALGMLGDFGANHVMGRALHDDDRTVRMLADNGIRNVWKRSGSASDQEDLEAIIQLNVAKQFEQAGRRASALVKRAPWLAEAWNQRAIAHFAMGSYMQSIRDCHQTLELNPYHFAAASGMGHAYLQLNNHVSALECFRRALRLNPDLEQARAQVHRLTRIIEGK